MSFTSHAQLAEALLPDILQAARVILETRANGLIVDVKADRSPVTDADRRAEIILETALHRILPGIPVIAEERTAAGQSPDAGSTFFLVDPLDGTKDYCAGRDDFSINIGMIDKGRSVFGIVYAPARKEFFATLAPGEASAAHLDASAQPSGLADLKAVRVGVRPGKAGSLVALVSRSEAGPDYADRIAALGVGAKTGMSSAIKFCLLARGDADIYPRFGPTCEWDTAAGQAVLEAAGGSVSQLDGSPMIYGKAASGYLNGGFVARGAAVG
jgi:3'(2'), 5'-bisphosphate nucleotidase